jgi:hypothetical protein
MAEAASTVAVVSVVVTGKLSDSLNRKASRNGWQHTLPAVLFLCLQNKSASVHAGR